MRLWVSLPSRKQRQLLVHGRPSWNRKLEAAARLVGPKRFKVYGQMDIDLMRQVAPIAAMRTYNDRYFFSNRVNPKSLVSQGIYSDWSIPALALK